MCNISYIQHLLHVRFLISFRYKRSVTLPFIASEKGFGFSFIGGNVVGLFVSEVKVGRKELQVGDQILEIAGHNAVQMSHYEASDIISHVKDKLFLKVTQNPASKLVLLRCNVVCVYL